MEECVFGAAVSETGRIEPEARGIYKKGTMYAQRRQDKIIDLNWHCLRRSMLPR